MSFDAASVFEIRTTFGSREHAEACAKLLVERRLAACVQIEGPVRSTYRWRDTLEVADEFRCICKTTRERLRACVEAVVDHHPYETPEVIWTEATASEGYAAWVRASVEPA